MTRSKKEDGFGFRLLESFNNALLVKMEAMIISKLDALWVRVLKGLYFPSTNFIQTVKGSRAPWGRVNLMYGRDIVWRTGVWSLGNEKTIRVFMDPYIPCRYKIRLGDHLVTKTQSNTRMEEWIKPVDRTWKESTVKASVSNEDAQIILNILIPTEPWGDKLR